MNDEYAALVASSHGRKKRFDLGARFGDAQAVQVDAGVDWHEAAAQAPKCVERDIRASPFDAQAVVGHLEASLPLDERAQVFAHPASASAVATSRPR